MKIAKDYSNVPTIYYKSEMTKCLECESRIERSHSEADGTNTLSSFREPYMLCLWGIAVPMMTALQEWFTVDKPLTYAETGNPLGAH